MNIIDVILLAVSLSMDAFAVALCKGLALKKITLKNCLTVGAWFGIFQGAMPLLGYLLGSAFADKIQAIDHWIAFGLLVIIGGNMIKESLSKDEDATYDEYIEIDLNDANESILYSSFVDSVSYLTFQFGDVPIAGIEKIYKKGVRGLCAQKTIVYSVIRIERIKSIKFI